MIGPPGCGKSHLAQRHFAVSEVVSSDHLRYLISDNAADQSATTEAFALLHQVVEARLKRNLLTVVDATNLKAQDRAALLDHARRHHVRRGAVLFDLPLKWCLANNARRSRQVPEAIVRQLHAQCPSIKTLHREFDFCFHLQQPQALDSPPWQRVSSPELQWQRHGPFDLVGDVHGCIDVLHALLERLGWQRNGEHFTPPPGRQAVFLGDLVDRGPNTPAVLRLVMRLWRNGEALCVLGNHDDKLRRALLGHRVSVSGGLERSLQQLAKCSESFRQEVIAFISALPTHLVLDAGRLVAVHAGLPEALHGRYGRKVRHHALYGDTTGKTGADGHPERRDWAATYQGAARVVHGHTPVEHLQWRNHVLCLDTGCVFGGALSALRYPELETLSVDTAGNQGVENCQQKDKLLR